MFKLSIRRFINHFSLKPYPAFYSKPRLAFRFSSTQNPEFKPTEKTTTSTTSENKLNENKTKPDEKPQNSENKPENNSSQTKGAETSTDNTKNPEKDQNTSKEESGMRERLKSASPTVSKCLEFGIYAWNLTFPKERYHDKFEKVKQRAREAKKAETIILTEEDMLKMQDEIPEWKRTALILKEEQAARESLKAKVANRFKNKFNETKFAHDIYKSDSFKEFQTFKKEMHQFKEDLKDHIENSPNPVVQTSLGIYSKVSNESTVARAIKEMRKIDPTFDLYELEDDAKGIFEAAYTTYLNGKLDLLEKMCGEMALGYFKVLLRKMEAEKCEPKYKYLWQIDPASFSTALIPEKKLPVFIFIIKTQEIYCNISKVDKRIVDGDDERLMNWEYQFAITPHSNPDLENVGHAWEIIELQPRQVLKMLV